MDTNSINIETTFDRKLLRKQRKRENTLDFIRRLFKRGASKMGWIIFALLVIVCLAAPLIAPYTENEMDIMHRLATPSLAHLCGTDALGRDVFSRLLYGGRYSLALGIVTSLLGSAIGVVIGSIAGYYGGTLETVIMRLMDIWASIPSLLLNILISVALGPGFFNTCVALAIGSVPNTVRMMRAMILSERTKEYLEAAESINCKKTSIMFKHLLPNSISPQIVTTTMAIGNTLRASSGLSFIGLGVQPPTPEWGAMLADGKAHILNYPHMIIFPGIAIALTVLAINLLGDGVRDALDPKLRD